MNISQKIDTRYLVGEEYELNKDEIKVLSATPQYKLPRKGRSRSYLVRRNYRLTKGGVPFLVCVDNK